MFPPRNKSGSVFQYQVFDKPFQYQTFDRVSFRPQNHPIPPPDKIRWSPRYTDDSLQSADDVQGRELDTGVSNDYPLEKHAGKEIDVAADIDQDPEPEPVAIDEETILQGKPRSAALPLCY